MDKRKSLLFVNAFRDLNSVKTHFSGLCALEDYEVSERKNILI